MEQWFNYYKIKTPSNLKKMKQFIYITTYDDFVDIKDIFKVDKTKYFAKL